MRVAPLVIANVRVWFPTQAPGEMAFPLPLTLRKAASMLTWTVPNKTKEPQGKPNPPVLLRVPPLMTRFVKVVTVSEESIVPPLSCTGVIGFVKPFALAPN